MTEQHIVEKDAPLAAVIGLLPDCNHPTSRGACPDCIAQAVQPFLARAWDEGERHESDYLATWGQFCPSRDCNPYRPLPPGSDQQETL